MRWAPRWVLGGVACILAGCGDPANVEVAKGPEPIRIGLLLPLSGPQASFGNDAIRGAQMASSEILAEGGILERPIEFVIEDTASDAETAQEGVARLASEESVVAIVGEIASARTMAAAEAAQRLAIPLLSPAATHEKITRLGEFIFRSCYEDPLQAAAMARFADSVKARRVAILVEEGNPYSEQLAGSFEKTIADAGGEITAKEVFQSGDDSFSEQIEAIKKSRPDLVYLPSYFSEAALVIREARRLDLDVPFVGGDGWDSPEFLSVGGDAVEGCYFTSHFSHEQPGSKGFVTAFEERFGAPPPPLSALTYDAVHLLAAAIANAGTIDRGGVRASLAAMPPHEGVTGTIAMEENRSPRKPVVILRVEDGRFTYLETMQNLTQVH